MLLQPSLAAAPTKSILKQSVSAKSLPAAEKDAVINSIIGSTGANAEKYMVGYAYLRLRQHMRGIFETTREL